VTISSQPFHYDLSNVMPSPRTFIPFFLLSLLLHLAFLSAVRLPTKYVVTTPPPPITIYLDTIPTAIPFPIRNGSPSAEQDNTTKYPAFATQINQFPEPANTQQFMDSAIGIAHDEARTNEQLDAAQEKKNLSTPAALLAQYLRVPHKEIRLANGMLKIVTDAGEICFQSTPDFARDTPGLFNIPISCP